MWVYFVCAAFLVGVALSSFINVGVLEILFVVFLGVVVLFITPFLNNKTLSILVSICIFAFALGVWRINILPPLTNTNVDRFLGEETTFDGIVSDDPDEREHSVLIKVYLEDEDVKILARAPAYTSVSYGDVVRVSGELVLPESFDTDTGRVFNYPGYLAVSGVGYILKDAGIEVLSTGDGNPIISALFKIKHSYLRGIRNSLPEPAAALAGGITAGDKRSLGADLLDDFRIAGIVHIVVLSGYNVTIIAETLLRALAFLPVKAGLFAGAFAIAGFAMMTGAGASIVRASIMAILALIARAIHRPYAISRALALAVVGMVIWNPYVLVHDPGFQLSVLATIGLIFVSPLISGRALWIPEKLGMREVVGATIGTQLTVLPLLLYQMGNLSIIALPVNLLVLFVIPMAMLLSFFAAIIGIIFPFGASIAGFPAYLILSYVLEVVRISTKVPYAEVFVPVFSVWWMVAAYVLMFSWLLWVYKNK